MPTFSFTATAFSTLDTSSGIENLAPQMNKAGPATLSNAFNVRFTENGGLTNRPGFTNLVTLGSSAKVDDACTLTKYNVTFWKSGTGIYVATRDQLENGTAYSIGATRTASEKDFLFPHDSDVYATNETDTFLRIAVAKATVAIADTDVTITVDDIGQFASPSGTIYVNGDEIAYTGVSGSTLTGVSGIQAGGHAINSIVTQTSSISGAPKGYCMGELEGSGLIGKGPLLYGSLPSTDQNPEYFYNFTVTSGATIKRLSGDIKCIKSGLRVAMIGMIDGIDFSDGFDPTTGALLTYPLTRTHGVPNNRCIVEFDNKFAVLSNEGRILVAMQSQTGFELLDSPDNRKNFDYPVYGYIKKNKHATDNSVNSISYNPATKLLKAVILLNTGITAEFVCQTDIGAWSIDDSKNFRCRTVVNGTEYVGDDSLDYIHREDYGQTDNLVPITTRATTGVFRLGNRDATADWLDFKCGGYLNATGQFYFSITVDGALIQRQLVTAAYLVSKGLMSLDTGYPVGYGQIGAKEIGSAGQVTEVFKFDYPYELMADGETAQVEFEVIDEGSILELSYFSLGGEHEGELLITHS